MAGQVVQMDYNVMGEVSKGFGTSRDTLTVVGKVLEGIIFGLRMASFLSFGTSAALANYLEVIKGKVNNLAKICGEFSEDLSRAITDHQKGDIKGKHYFGEGVSR